MKSLLALFLLGAAVSPALASETPCYRELGGVHIPELLNASPSERQSELQIQTECLVLEYSVFPKAEFIPPAVALHPAGRGVTRITVVEASDEHHVTALTFGPSSNRTTLIEQPDKPAFGLGSPSTVLSPGQ